MKIKDNRANDTDVFFADEELYEDKTILRKTRKSRFKVFIIIVAIFMSLVLLYLAARSFFSVDTVIINGNSRYKTELIIEQSGIELGDFLFGFASSDIEARICEYCPYIVSASLVREYPSTIRIDVVETTAQYYTSQMNKYIAFSGELKVLEVSDIDIWDGFAVYMKIPDVKRAIEGQSLLFFDDVKVDHIKAFISAISSVDIECPIDLVDLSDSFSIRMLCDKRLEITLGKDKELLVKLQTLKKVISSDTVKNCVAASIDISDPKEPRVTPFDTNDKITMSK